MKWYGRKYPSQDDLESAAWDLGAVVVYGAVPTAFCCMHPEGPIIGLPEDAGPLEKAWLLAHELGHLAQHSGPKNDLSYRKGESQADRWAARALIPEAAVRRYQNASLDAFIGALSKHYEDIPFKDCHQRKLAGVIAGIRLDALREEVA